MCSKPCIVRVLATHDWFHETATFRKISDIAAALCWLRSVVGIRLKSCVVLPDDVGLRFVLTTSDDQRR